MTLAADLLARLSVAGPAAERVAGAGPVSVWRIGPGRLGEKLRGDLLDLVLGSGRDLYIRHEDPIDWEVPGTFTATRHCGTWRVGGDVDPRAAATAAWLEVGDWTLYRGPEVVDWPLPDLARAPAAAILELVAEHRLELLVDAFHDNASWMVAVAREERR